MREGPWEGVPAIYYGMREGLWEGVPAIYYGMREGLWEGVTVGGGALGGVPAI